MTPRIAKSRRLLAVAALAIAALGLAASATLAVAQGRPHYRSYAMGDDLQATAHRLGVPVLDATTTPAVSGAVQELRWHARYVRRGTAPAGDPVDRLVFSFFEHRLFRIVIDYAPDRTEGMTEADMVAAVSALFGEPARRTLVASATAAVPVRPSETVIAHWVSGDQAVVLLAIQGRTAFRMIVVSTALENLARASGAREAPVDRPDWPSIDEARARADISGAGPIRQKARRANIASFIP